MSFELYDDYETSGPEPLTPAFEAPAQVSVRLTEPFKTDISSVITEIETETEVICLKT